MSQLLVIVPARGNSQRLPGKHAMPLAGRTLLEWTADAIAESGLAAPCLFTTDDPGLAERGRRLGWMVPFLRPAELARPETPTADAILHALDWYVGAGHPEPRHVLLVQATSPLRRGRHLAEAVDMLWSRRDADAVIGVVESDATRHQPYWLDAASFLRKSETPDTRRVLPNGAVYAIEAEMLRRLRAFFTARTLGYLMDADSSIDIDAPDDWRAAEAALRARGQAGAARAGEMRDSATSR